MKYTTPFYLKNKPDPQGLFVEISDICPDVRIIYEYNDCSGEIKSDYKTQVDLADKIISWSKQNPNFIIKKLKPIKEAVLSLF
jgi:hypothetical protein